MVSDTVFENSALGIRRWALGVEAGGGFDMGRFDGPHSGPYEKRHGTGESRAVWDVVRGSQSRVTRELISL